jgi:hypothetical protein
MLRLPCQVGSPVRLAAQPLGSSWKVALRVAMPGTDTKTYRVYFFSALQDTGCREHGA